MNRRLIDTLRPDATHNAEARDVKVGWLNIEYDPESDGAYIWLVADIEKEKARYAGEIRPAEFHGEVGFLVDEAGKILGIEFQPASKYLDTASLPAP